MAVSSKMREKITQNAVDRINQLNMVEGVNLYIYADELNIGKDLPGFFVDKQFSINAPETDSIVLVFADMDPTLNWSHDCRHMLYHAETGELLQEFDDIFPPSNYFQEFEKYEGFHTPVKMPDVPPEKKNDINALPGLAHEFSKIKGKRYAILFAGMANNRHTNDLEYLYRTLIDIYKFEAGNITVLNYNGNIDYSGPPHPVGNWPGDNTPYRMVVNGQGTKAAFQNALNAISGKIKENDGLLIHTNNHGAGIPNYNQAWLCAYPNYAKFWASDFGDMLKAMPKFYSLIVMMEQCHSGGFSDTVINNSKAKWTHFCAACAADRSSIGGANFDPFAYDWISGMTGKAEKTSGDDPDCTAVSAASAFAYADKIHDPYDTPNAADTPVGCGSFIYLNKLCLKLLDFVQITVADELKNFGLYYGDLTDLNCSEKAGWLVVSSLPNDYSPTPGSLIGALNGKGISVQALSQDKAADYEPELACWVSKEITSTDPTIQFSRILLFEPPRPSGQTAPAHVKDILAGIKRYLSPDNPKTSVLSPMVSTGSAGADPTAILTALYNSIVETMKSDFKLNFTRVVIYNQNEVDPLTALFEKLKKT